MRVAIRKATPVDWQIIQRLNHEVFVNNKQHDVYENVNWPLSKEAEKYYQETTSNTKHITLIAEIKGKAIGYITGSKKDFAYRTNIVIEIDNMGVSPKHRSLGVGRKLVEEFKKIAKKKKFTHVYVESYYKNQKANHFYQKQGLKPIGLELEGKL
jgi:ribosomal protein S18 acetylase RimI-like enzyme